MNWDRTITNRSASFGMAGIVLSLGMMYAAPAWAQDATPPLPPEQIGDGSDKLGVQPPPEGEPTQPIETGVEAEAEADAEAQAEIDAAADRAALESELASARRFEAELEALLLTDGQLDTTQGDDALIKLAGLATRCGILANSAMHDEVKLVLLGYQARALAALASLEPAAQEQDPSRLEQLGEVAQQIGLLDLPAAQPTADYWQLLADMARLASSKETPAQVRELTEWVLSRYIDQHEDNEHAGEYLLDARLSLAQLMDQRGAQREVAKQLKHIGKLPPDSSRAQELQRLHDSIARIGTAIEFESLSTQLATWRSSDHRGKPVLIHVYADRVEPSVRMIDVISRSIVEGTLSGIAVVSLRVGEPIASSAAPPWPTLPVQLEPKGVLDQLGVAALPTLAWLDDKGQLVSIGTAPAVLDQLAALQPDESGDKQEPAPEQETEQAPDEPSKETPKAQPIEPIDPVETDELDVENPSN